MHVVAAVRAFLQHRGGGVGADVAGDARQHVQVRVGQIELDVVGPRVDRLVGGERERRGAERRRIDAEHEVVHDRVADEHDVDDAVARRCRPSATSCVDARRGGRRGSRR